jgi:predicted GNAT family N-acyltransferase
VAHGALHAIVRKVRFAARHLHRATIKCENKHGMRRAQLRARGEHGRHRPVAVAAADQGRGCGSIIICCLEELLLISGFQHVCLNARISAAGFYAKLGFSAIGAQFIEVGIPHIKMQKKLGPQAVDASASGFE